jgi:hypothetical protein
MSKEPLQELTTLLMMALCGRECSSAASSQ